MIKGPPSLNFAQILNPEDLSGNFVVMKTERWAPNRILSAVRDHLPLSEFEKIAQRMTLNYLIGKASYNKQGFFSTPFSLSIIFYMHIRCESKGNLDTFCLTMEYPFLILFQPKGNSWHFQSRFQHSWIRISLAPAHPRPRWIRIRADIPVEPLTLKTGSS